MSSTDSDDVGFYDMIIRANHQIIYQHQQQQQRNDEATSSRRTRRYIERDRDGANQRLIEDYFAENPRYPPEYFKRRFRMSKELFLRIVESIRNYSLSPIPEHFVFFQQRPDARGVQGCSTLQKCTAAIRQLAYGTTPDAFDEYLQMSERTSRECLYNFTKCIIDLYADVYMRKPTYDDIQRLYAKHEEIHGFSGMLGSIDCMHWAWDKCPSAWKGQYTRGDQGVPTIMLEAVASYDLWFWHAYFGVAGSNNDINVLNHSPLFTDMVNDNAPIVSYTVNDVQYTHGYYLADGIYPNWSTFVKAFSSTRDEKRGKFKAAQESARKDIERAFGVLQGRWHIIQQPARAYKVNVIRRIMYTCIILHNMIIEDNGFSFSEVDEWYTAPQHPHELGSKGVNPRCEKQRTT